MIWVLSAFGAADNRRRKNAQIYIKQTKTRAKLVAF